MFFQQLSLQTEREGTYALTDEVRAMVRQSGIQNGLCVVYCPHTTAAVTLNENADPDVRTDLLYGLDGAYPDRKGYRHIEKNSAAHLKSSCVGASETLIVLDGALQLGTWQGIYFMEFDGPRHRSVYVSILGEAAEG